ncbi:unnamed protein product [Cochlearia groenlandica]
MASSSDNTNPPFDLTNLFRHSSIPYSTPPTGPFLPSQFNQQLYAPPVTQPSQQQEAALLPSASSSSSATNNFLQPERSLSYPTPPLNLQSPRANHNPGTHILALLNNNNNGALTNQEPRRLGRRFPEEQFLFEKPTFVSFLLTTSLSAH